MYKDYQNTQSKLQTIRNILRATCSDKTKKSLDIKIDRHVTSG